MASMAALAAKLDLFDLDPAYQLDQTPISSFQHCSTLAQMNSIDYIWSPDVAVVEEIIKLNKSIGVDQPLMLASHGIHYDPLRRIFIKIYSFDNTERNKVIPLKFLSFRRNWVQYIKDDGWSEFIKFTKTLDRIEGDGKYCRPFNPPCEYLPLSIGYVCGFCGQGFLKNHSGLLSLSQHHLKNHPKEDDLFKLVSYIQQSGDESKPLIAVKVGLEQLIHLQKIDNDACAIYKKMLKDFYSSPVDKSMVNVFDCKGLFNNLMDFIIAFLNELKIMPFIFPVLVKLLDFIKNAATVDEIKHMIDDSQNEYTKFVRENPLESDNFIHLELKDALGCYIGYIFQLLGFPKTINFNSDISIEVLNEYLMKCNFGSRGKSVHDCYTLVLVLISIVCQDLKIFLENWPTWKSKEFRVLHAIRESFKTNKFSLEKLNPLNFTNLEKFIKNIDPTFNKTYPKTQPVHEELETRLVAPIAPISPEALDSQERRSPLSQSAVQPISTNFEEIGQSRQLLQTPGPSPTATTKRVEIFTPSEEIKETSLMALNELKNSSINQVSMSNDSENDDGNDEINMNLLSNSSNDDSENANDNERAPRPTQVENPANQSSLNEIPEHIQGQQAPEGQPENIFMARATKLSHNTALDGSMVTTDIETPKYKPSINHSLMGKSDWGSSYTAKEAQRVIERSHLTDQNNLLTLSVPVNSKKVDEHSVKQNAQQPQEVKFGSEMENKDYSEDMLINDPCLNTHEPIGIANEKAREVHAHNNLLNTARESDIHPKKFRKIQPVLIEGDSDLNLFKIHGSPLPLLCEDIVGNNHDSIVETCIDGREREASMNADPQIPHSPSDSNGDKSVEYSDLSNIEKIFLEPHKKNTQNTDSSNNNNDASNLVEIDTRNIAKQNELQQQENQQLFNQQTHYSLPQRLEQQNQGKQLTEQQLEEQNLIEQQQSHCEHHQNHMHPIINSNPITQNDLRLQMHEILSTDEFTRSLFLEYRSFMGIPNDEWNREKVLQLIEIIKLIIIRLTYKSVGENTWRTIHNFGNKPGFAYQLNFFNDPYNSLLALYASHFLVILLTLNGIKFKLGKYESFQVDENWCFTFDDMIQTTEQNLSIATTIILLRWGVVKLRISEQETYLIGSVVTFINSSGYDCRLKI